MERVDALEALQRRVSAQQLQLKSAQDAICKLELARETEFFLSSAQALQISFKVLGNARGRLQVIDTSSVHWFNELEDGNLLDIAV